MNRSSDALNEGAASILRALGSLLVALSGHEGQPSQVAAPGVAEPRPTVPPRPASLPQYAPPPTPRYAPPPAGPEGSFAAAPPPPTASTVSHTPSAHDHSKAPASRDAEFILADARERAQRILDDSMERARELLRPVAATPQAEAVDHAAVEELRRSMYDLVAEVRDVQVRLARIETLIREGQPQAARIPIAQSAPTPTPAAPPPAPQPVVTPPTASFTAYAPSAPASGPKPELAPEPTFEAEPAPESPPVSQEPLATEQPEIPADPLRPTAMPAPAPAPPSTRSGLSVVPPQRSDETPAVPAPPPSATPRMRQAAAAHQPEPPPADTDDMWIDDPIDEGSSDSGAPIATFLPADGAIVLRVMPVSGFQGLMRVQDALSRLPSVRHAAVEAYSQGEARLRIELADPTDSEEIADGLSRSLQGPAHVEQASESGRELLIALR